MKKIKFGEVSLIEIVGDGAIASSRIGVGRLIPCLILDLEDRKDISKLLKLNPSSGPMDSKVQWGRPIRTKDLLFLRVSYEKPFELEFFIKFDVIKHGLIVETIMNNKAVIIYEGKAGDSVSEKVANKEDSLLIEVPDLGYKKTWRKNWKKKLIKKYRQKGFSKSKAKTIAESEMNEIEEFKKIQID